MLAAAAMISAFTAPATEAWGSTRQDRERKTKIYLQKENRKLVAVIDSLQAELSRYQSEMRRNDSIADEIMDLYDENEGKSAAGLNPEDYNTGCDRQPAQHLVSPAADQRKGSAGL